MPRIGFALLAGAVAATTCSAQFQFVDSAGTSGIGAFNMAFGMGGGVAAADYDNDGDVDMFVPNGFGFADQLYLNLGDGTYTDIAPSAGLDSTENNRCALWIDYDGDKDLDLLVVSDDHERTTDLTTSTLRLYRQDGPTSFTDVTVSAGLFGPQYAPSWTRRHHIGGLAAGDLNNDGYLEILVVLWRGLAHLYLNDTQGGFTNVTLSAGLPVVEETFWQPIMHDFNDDGYLDIFCAVDFVTNDLWINQQNMTFVNVAPSLGIENPDENDMGVTLGDMDNDGDFDLYVSNVDSFEQRRAHLFRNESVGATLSFVEQANEGNVAYAGFGWGTTFADFDRDMLVDLAVTNGFAGHNDPTYCFQNTGTDGSGNTVFVDQHAAVGLTAIAWGSCLLAFDAERDGDLDLIEADNAGPLRHYVSDESVVDPSGSYLIIRPRMNTGANHFAIGAVVRVQVGSTTMSRLITAGTSLMGQEPAEAFFGLGSASTVDQIDIEWPDGTTTSVTGPTSSNQMITITEAGVSCGVDLAPTYGVVDFFDLLAFLNYFDTNSPFADMAPPYQQWDFFDVLEFLSQFSAGCP